MVAFPWFPIRQLAADLGNHPRYARPRGRSAFESSSCREMLEQLLIASEKHQSFAARRAQIMRFGAVPFSALAERGVSCGRHLYGSHSPPSVPKDQCHK
jgi:hypothetical protein